MGHTDDPKHCMVKLFCPKCQDVYSCAPNQRRTCSIVLSHLTLSIIASSSYSFFLMLSPIFSLLSYLFYSFIFRISFQCPSSLFYLISSHLLTSPISSLTPSHMLLISDIDGAFFGPTFPNLFFMTYEDVVPEPVTEQVCPVSCPSVRVPYSYRLSYRCRYHYHSTVC